MSDSRGIFFDDWQACLRAHYVHVLRANDAITERTLRGVLLQSGVTEAELAALHDRALALGPLEPDVDHVDRGVYNAPENDWGSA